MKNSIFLLATCWSIALTTYAAGSALIKEEQARDLRLLLLASPEVEEGRFLLDTSQLNSSSTRSSAHGRFYLNAPQSLQSILSAFRDKHPEDIFLSKQSTVVVFSKKRVVRFDLYNASTQELSDFIVGEGDVVIIGNFGDYL